MPRQKKPVDPLASVVERDAQVSVVDWLKAVLPRGSVVAAVKNEHAARSPSKWGRIRFYEKRKQEGVTTGFPDLVLDLPGRTLYIEMKRPVGGKLEDEQQRIHEQLRANGKAVGVCVDIESAREFLLREGVPLREAPGQPTRVATVRMAKRLVDDALPF